MNIWDKWVAYRLEASVDNPKTSHAVQALSDVR